MGKRKFDTCFFERYAQISLEEILGKEYAGLVNEDRPDLQMPDRSLGIEVTRAMEPSKNVAASLLKSMAGMDVGYEDREDISQIIRVVKDPGVCAADRACTAEAVDVKGVAAA